MSELDESKILTLIADDPEMMRILVAAADMNLPDWLIGAGFVRNKVWDYLHGYTKNTPPTDIDLVYFDKEKMFNEKEIEKKLSTLMPGLKWEVVNQATAHEWSEEPPSTSTADAIAKWPETATAVGVTMKDGRLQLVAPLGIDDLVRGIVRPTPAFMAPEKRTRAQERIAQKRWVEKWPKLQVVTK